MNKFKKSVVLKYINGEDIERYEIETLENDPEFMMMAINMSGDAKLYNMCSETVKNDYQFLKFFITKFKNNKELITYVVEDYLRVNRCEEEVWELNILMSNFIDDYNEKIKYILKAKTIFVIYMSLVERELKKNLYNNMLLGKGFTFFYNIYPNNENIQYYCASCFINAIFFGEEDLTFEQKLHQIYKKEDIKKMGENNFLLSFLQAKDPSLFDFTVTHLKLLDEVKKELDRILKHWDAYERIMLDLKTLEFIDKVTEIVVRSREPIYIEDVVEYVLEEKNLKELVSNTQSYQKYNNFEYDMIEATLTNMSDESYSEYLNNNINMTTLKLKKPLEEMFEVKIALKEADRIFDKSYIVTQDKFKEEKQNKVVNFHR